MSAIKCALVCVRRHAELVELTGLVCEKPAWLDSVMPALILNQRSQNSCCFVFCYVGRDGGIRAGRLSRGLFTTMEMRWKLNSDWTNLLNYDWYEIVTKYYLVIFGSDFIDTASLRLSSIPVSSFAKEAWMGAVVFEGRIGGLEDISMSLKPRVSWITSEWHIFTKCPAVLEQFVIKWSTLKDGSVKPTVQWNTVLGYTLQCSWSLDTLVLECQILQNFPHPRMTGLIFLP